MNPGPAKAKKPPQGLEGVTYTHHGMPYTGQGTGAKRRRKVTLEDLYRTREACERSQRASDDIRASARVWIVAVGGGPAGRGLPPVPTNYYREALERAIVEAKAAPAPRKAKAASNGNGASPAVDIPPVPPASASLSTVKAAVAERNVAERNLVAEVARARDAKVSMAAMAAELGITRQGLYKYLARA